MPLRYHHLHIMTKAEAQKTTTAIPNSLFVLEAVPRNGKALLMAIDPAAVAVAAIDEFATA